MRMEFDEDKPGTELMVLTDQRSPVSIGRAVAEFVGRELVQIDAAKALRFGRAIYHVVTVDGRRNVALYEVKPQGGEISAEWSSPVLDVLLWIAMTLDDRSPVLSGEYQRSHLLLADGVLVDVLGEVPDAKEYCFFNAAPYARRLEIGKTESGRDFVVQVPPRIYERTAKDAASRFGNIARITSEFITPSDAYSLRRNQASRSFARGRRVSGRQRSDRVAGSAVSVPAIFMRTA